MYKLKNLKNGDSLRLVRSGYLFRRVFLLFVPCAHPLLHVIPIAAPPVLSFPILYLWSSYLLWSKPLCTNLDTSKSRKTPCLFWSIVDADSPSQKPVHPPLPLFFLTFCTQSVHKACPLKLLRRSWISFCPRVSQQWHRWHMGLDCSSCGGCGEGGWSCSLWNGEQHSWLLLIRLRQDHPSCDDGNAKSTQLRTIVPTSC